jgi:hypothetical protein
MVVRRRSRRAAMRSAILPAFMSLVVGAGAVTTSSRARELDRRPGRRGLRRGFRHSC